MITRGVRKIYRLVFWLVSEVFRNSHPKIGKSPKTGTLVSFVVSESSINPPITTVWLSLTITVVSMVRFWVTGRVDEVVKVVEKEGDPSPLRVEVGVVADTPYIAYVSAFPPPFAVLRTRRKLTAFGLAEFSSLSFYGIEQVGNRVMLAVLGYQLQPLVIHDEGLLISL